MPVGQTLLQSTVIAVIISSVVSILIALIKDSLSRKSQIQQSKAEIMLEACKLLINAKQEISKPIEPNNPNDSVEDFAAEGLSLVWETYTNQHKEDVKIFESIKFILSTSVCNEMDMREKNIRERGQKLFNYAVKYKYGFGNGEMMKIENIEKMSDEEFENLSKKQIDELIAYSSRLKDAIDSKLRELYN